MSKVCQISLNMREDIYDFAHMMAGEMGMSVAAYVRGLIEIEMGKKPSPASKPEPAPKPVPTPVPVEAVKPVVEKQPVEAVQPLVDEEARAAMRAQLAGKLGLVSGGEVRAQPKKAWK